MSAGGDTGGGCWVGFDLDGTLAEYTGWQGEGHIGAPVPAMVAKVRELLLRGVEVRIVTARVSSTSDSGEVVAARMHIQNWAEKHLGRSLPVTCRKDYGMLCLYDDRAVAVEKNTGRVLGGVEP